MLVCWGNSIEDDSFHCHLVHSTKNVCSSFRLIYIFGLLSPHTTQPSPHLCLLSYVELCVCGMEWWCKISPPLSIANSRNFPTHTTRHFLMRPDLLRFCFSPPRLIYHNVYLRLNNLKLQLTNLNVKEWTFQWKSNPHPPFNFTTFSSLSRQIKSD